MINMDANNFFDENASFYGGVKLYEHDFYLLDSIKKTGKGGALKLLDIGGGSGVFAKFIATECPNIEVTLLEPSESMSNQMDDARIIKISGMLPHNISVNNSYDYIHIKEVLHHITGSSIKESKKLLEESLVTINEILADDGFLLIHELFYESLIYPPLTSTLIYHLLRFKNKYGINIPINEFRDGLDVYFYNRDDFRKFLTNCGYEVVDYYEVYFDNTLKKRLMFLDNWGRMVFICKKL